MSFIATPSALSEGMLKRAMPSRVFLLLWRFSQASADWRSASTRRNADAFTKSGSR